MTAWKTLAIPSWLDQILEDIKKAKKKRNKWEIIYTALKAYLEDNDAKAMRFVEDIERVMEIYGITMPGNGRAFFRKLYQYLADPDIDHDTKNFKMALLIDVLKGDYKLLNTSVKPEDIEAEEQSLKELGIIESEEPEEQAPAYEVIDGENEEEVLEEETKELLAELQRKAQAGDEEAKRLLALFTALDQGL